MHCELIVTGLLPPVEAAAILAGLRLPALELLLARGRQKTEEARTLEAWLAESFDGDPEAEVPAGALTEAALGGDPDKAQWLRADPVHVKLGRDRMALIPAAAFGVDAPQAVALTDTLNRHFAGALHFDPVQPERWCVRVDTLPLAGLRTRTLAEVAGRDINRSLPAGVEARRWHGVLNEIQMVLHEHPVNEAREARGEPAVNSLWLWGAGSLPGKGAAPWQSVSADDPLACGYAQLAGLRHRPLPADADTWLARLPEDGRQLAVLDGLRLPFALDDFDTWRVRVAEFEERWFAPMLAALKTGRIGMATICVPDAAEQRSFESTRNDLRHFWRRPKPLSGYL